MRSQLRLPALAIAAILVIAACSCGTATTAPTAAAPSSRGAGSQRRIGAPRRPSRRRPRPRPRNRPKACAQSADANAMQMWERSGGNKGMVDILVCAWNAANPTKPINLSYIVHTEMVAKIAQGIASGDVPDLMGMDLIYAPQFENADQLVDITDQTKDWPELADVSPGHKTVATFNDRLFGVPLYADVSALFYNKDLFTKAGLDPNKPPTSLAEIRDVRRQDHRARRRRHRLLPARQLRRLQHLHRRPADVGVRCHDRGQQVRRRAARRRRRQAGRPVGARHGRGQERPRQRASRDRCHLRRAVRVGQARHDGDGELQHRARARPDEGPPVRVRHQPAAGHGGGQVRLVHRWRPRRHPEGQQARRRRARVHALPADGHEAGRAVRQGAQPDDPHRPEAHRQPVLQGRTARSRTWPRRWPSAGRRTR